ncbi:MAG: CRISPR system precrRNA processing endoribonuclease RAMP protein Cas6 [Proteobacteria bacterium]|nr:CRISPR system precrRNA processing endoribonuclease RAMP protein Cas6 [Pseudomonadota bacterium]
MLPLARYRFTFRMAAPLRLPDYAGSLLRGQFGAALRRVSCMTGASTCDGCPLRATCPYPAIFEAPAPAAHAMQNFSHVPNPYVIEPPPFGTRFIDAGETLQFCVVLVGRAVDQLPLISFALQRAVEGGLGKERARGTLESIEWQAGDEESSFVSVWQTGDAAIALHDARFEHTAPVIADSSIRLRVHTPLRLQHQGHPVRPQALTPRKLVADLLRRTTLLAEFHADRPGLVADAPTLVRHAESLDHRPALRWQDWSRYSSRQQQEMTLGGAIGDWTLHGDLAPLLPWLRLGQWLHVGKNATMGMGCYTLHAA